MLNYIPQFFTKRAILTYLIALVVIVISFFSHAMSMLWVAFGLVEVFGFFYFANLLSKRWKHTKIPTFKKRLFSTSLFIRVLWVVFSYAFYQFMTGEPFEFMAADSKMYHGVALDLANRGYAHMQSVFWGMGIDDMGYATYLGTIYMLTGNSILIARLLKALLGAWTVLLIYKIARRNFGEATGRMAGVMAMLFPNLILYSGLHLKEVEMVFLITAFIERSDYLLRSGKISFTKIIWTLVLASFLFTFRTVLGVAALFALFSALLFSSARMLKMGNKIIGLIWVFVALALLAGGRISRQVEYYWSQRDANQQASMEWRAERKDGNTLARYGSTVIFAPAIFVLPVSTMVDIEIQQNQQLIHGGNYAKNILSFFMYFILFWIIRNKKWRDFVLIEAFFLSYLAILAMSSFAQSERFHQPILPFYIMFVAYGISKATYKTKKYFNWYAIAVFLVLVAWNFVKLKGRGLV